MLKSFRIARRLSNTADLSRGASSSSSSLGKLVDSFGRRHNYLRMSLTERCNLRCVYCMPEEGVKLTPDPDMPTLEERSRVLETFIDKFGVDKLRFTGGEPTLSPHLLPLVKLAKEKGVDNIGMTTNGLVLSKHLDKLVEVGLNSVNISLDTTNPQKFAKLSRRSANSYNQVRASVDKALELAQSHDLHVKLNCVLMRGVNDDELQTFVSMANKQPLDVRFIEIMPFQGNGWSSGQVMGYQEALEVLEYGHGIKLQPWKGLNSGSGFGRKEDKHDTTKWYHSVHTDAPIATSGDNHIENNPSPGVGRVGFITTMSSPFCAGCNRLRITANMKLKVCLFGEEELDLLPMLRNDKENNVKQEQQQEVPDALEASIKKAVWGKHASLGGHKAPEVLVEKENRSMIMIGG